MEGTGSWHAPASGISIFSPPPALPARPQDEKPRSLAVQAGHAVPVADGYSNNSVLVTLDKCHGSVPLGSGRSCCSSSDKSNPSARSPGPVKSSGSRAGKESRSELRTWTLWSPSPRGLPARCTSRRPQQRAFRWVLAADVLSRRNNHRLP